MVYDVFSHPFSATLFNQPSSWHVVEPDQKASSTLYACFGVQLSSTMTLPSPQVRCCAGAAGAICHDSGCVLNLLTLLLLAIRLMSEPLVLSS
jgi:hypothetical protein